MNNIKIIIGTNNINKIKIAASVIEELSGEKVSIKAVSAESGVAEAPHDSDIYKGALNRAKYCAEKVEESDSLFIGLESGLIHREGSLFEETWAVIIFRGVHYLGYSSGLALPASVVKKMKDHDLKHHEVMRQIDHDLGKSKSSDTWSTYTGDALSRDLSLRESIRNAAVQLFSTQDSLYRI